LLPSPFFCCFFFFRSRLKPAPPLRCALNVGFFLCFFGGLHRNFFPFFDSKPSHLFMLIAPHLFERSPTIRTRTQSKLAPGSPSPPPPPLLYQHNVSSSLPCRVFSPARLFVPALFLFSVTSAIPPFPPDGTTLGVKFFSRLSALLLLRSAATFYPAPELPSTPSLHFCWWSWDVFLQSPRSLDLLSLWRALTMPSSPPRCSARLGVQGEVSSPLFGLTQMFRAWAFLLCVVVQRFFFFFLPFWYSFFLGFCSFSRVVPRRLFSYLPLLGFTFN